MSDEEDKDAKTEEPSLRKMEEALEKGQVISSREVNNAFVLIVLTVMLAWVLPLIFNYSAIKLRLVIEHAGQINLDQGQTWNIIRSLVNNAMLALSPLFLLVIAAVIFSAMVQQGQFTFSFDSIDTLVCVLVIELPVVIICDPFFQLNVDNPEPSLPFLPVG